MNVAHLKRFVSRELVALAAWATAALCRPV